MPIYSYKCECGVQGDELQPLSASPPPCPKCGKTMERVMTFPAFWKMSGMGGYPSRRKFVSGSAPGTTRATKAWGDHDPETTKDYGFGPKANRGKES